jgi:hypothetical protein
MAKEKQKPLSTWEKRKRRVMGDDPDDPSLALPPGEWVVNPGTGARRFVPKVQK